MGPKKPRVAAAEALGGEETGVDPELAQVSEDGSLQELRDMFRKHLSVQQNRDDWQEKEAARQEARWKTMQHQFGLLQREVHERTTPDLEEEPSLGRSDRFGLPPESQRLSSRVRGQVGIEREPRLLRLNETDDIEHFLITFERIAEACQWPTTDWAVRLVALLTGKARAAYVNMDREESLDYEKVKAAILDKYNINQETYRLQFRATEVREDETPKELYVRLKDVYQKWVQPQQHTKEEIAEVFVLEQFLRMVSPDLQIWIKERNPSSAAEAASLADVFVAARHKAQAWTYGQWRESRDFRKPYRPPQPPMRTNSEGKFAGDRGGPTKQSPTFRSSGPRILVCFQCGQEGHARPQCPNNPANQANVCTVPRPSFPNRPIAPHCCTVVLNGREVRALVDTGSMQSLVSSDLVPIEGRNYSVVTRLRCVHGEERPYPTASVYVKVQGQPYFLEVGVVDDLPYPVILGQDFPLLLDLAVAKKDCNLALTRAMAKQGEVELPLSALPFYNADIEAQPGKTRKSKRQRRHDKLQFGAAHMEEFGVEQLRAPLGIPQDIGAMQQQDPDIGLLYQQAQGERPLSQTNKPGDSFSVSNGVLYKGDGSEARMVVPQKARGVVLELGHSIPWAGHLGRQKTIARISRHFFWPNMAREIAEFCRTCPECQRTTSRGPPKVPLEPLPVVGIPFEQLGMDVVGPLERSKAGNRYMLVITDYATRYPEVFALKTVKARNVATCLIQMFSRVGFPRTILTDQGSNFMSELLRQVYQLLGIKGIRTTPYHPQTDGLTERFNQTLKQMLRKFVSESGADWDSWLPYLLFAYREVPQASTGFSPFELMYGREVRGPLSLLKEAWMGDQEVPEAQNVLSYVLKMRERLTSMAQLAQQSLKHAQQRQRNYYDQRARPRSFGPGDKVLVMLPSDTSKLLTKWQGPFEVTRKLGSTTYEVVKPGQKRSRRVLHINLLKEWHERPETGIDALMIRQVPDEDEVEEQYLPLPSEGALELSHLSPTQQADIQVLCRPVLFEEKPGRTSLVEHQITLCEGAESRRRSYRIPERLLTTLKEEVDQMLAMGIIEPSKSEWCSPVVLVPKKDGSLRFCVDFRYLNSVSKFDSYPAPRIDDLIDSLGSAKWLTTIDLVKGYWQVPLNKSVKELTAFRTPWGLFHFSVMPFGLHGAPATFQRLMDQVLVGTNGYAAAYLDDVIIYSSSWEEHLTHLTEVLLRIESAGLTINPAKCAIAKKETEYLGYVIGGGLIKPQVQKLAAIQNCPLPQNKTQVRSFLGMAGWYRRFVPNFSLRAAALTDMTRKNCPVQVQWSGEAKEAFYDIKNVLCNEPVLYCPDFEKKFVLQTDASDLGLGAVLLQGEPDQQHPVAYISRKLFPREVRYSTVEKECLAVKWALDAFRYYLLGREFLLETDHRPLQWMDRMRDSNARITRWYLSMQPYRFIINHIPGRNNTTADFLSRLPA